MYRNDRKSGNKDGIYLLEKASSADAPFNLRGASSCVVANWWSSFDKKGWSLCNSGYYMRGMYRNSKTHGQGLHLIEQANCCKPNAQKGGWGTCYDLNVWTSFDAKGWSKCATGYYMTGLFRNDCDNLYCIENFKCCKMGVAKKKFLGCFKDTKDRALPYNASHGGASVDTCVDQCGEKGYKYVGRQYDGECWCGNSGYDKYGLFTESQCDCDAQNVGPWRQCVYDIKLDFVSLQVN